MVSEDKRGHVVHTDICGIDEQGDYVVLTIDHIVPVSKGGGDTLDNMQILCKPCNERKADK